MRSTAWIVCGLVTLAAIATAQTTPAGDPAGHWEGAIEMPGGNTLGVIIELTPGDAWTGKIDIPMQGANGLPLDKIAVDGAKVSFAIKGVPGAPTFDGTVEGGRIEGTFTQGNFKLPFSLSREKSVSGSLVRPQEPKPPFPYREIEITVPAGDHTLAGTLTLPEGDGRFPLAVFITGSGPQNRDEELFGHKPFRLLADRLARAGIASLRCDDRGTGKSTGDFKSCTSEDFARDVEAQIAFLGNRSEIAADRIGLIGHSEGGLVAPMVASRKPKEVAFCVLIAPPGVPGEQILTRQLELMSGALGMTAQQIEAAQQAQAEVLAALRESPSPSDTESRLRDALGRAFDATPDAMRAAMGDRDEFIAAQLEQVNSPWMRSFVTYDPRPALRKVTQPVLAVWGGLDLQVDPTQNAGEVETALGEADNRDATLKTLDGLNHLLQPAQSGAITEYAQIETTMDEAAIELIVGWIKQRFVK